MAILAVDAASNKSQLRVSAAFSRLESIGCPVDLLRRGRKYSPVCQVLECFSTFPKIGSKVPLALATVHQCTMRKTHSSREKYVGVRDSS